MLSAKDSLELFKSIEEAKLLKKLVEQLNKDFLLANINVSFEISTSIDSLKNKLATTLINLVNNKYDDYLNLIYRIDISEKELSLIKSDNLLESVEQISFLILKREFQKVWLKQNYK